MNCSATAASWRTPNASLPVPCVSCLPSVSLLQVYIYHRGTCHLPYRPTQAPGVAVSLCDSTTIMSKFEYADDSQGCYVFSFTFFDESCKYIHFGKGYAFLKPKTNVSI